MSSAIHGAKVILDTLNVGELRAIEDYCQRLRIKLQEDNLHTLIGEGLKPLF